MAEISYHHLHPMQRKSAEITIVVPAYWTWESGTPPRPGDAVYDHPTPPDQPGTLARLLESLSAISRPEFNVIVITATTNPQLEAKAEAKVEEIIAPFRRAFPIAQFAPGDLLVLRRHVEGLGFSGLAPLISLRGYGNVRNIQLIVPYLLGSEVIVALDDDEVVGPDYLAKATEFIGREHQGKAVLGVAGFYLDREGNKLLPEGEPTGNIFLDKSAIMNEGTRALEAAPGRLVQTPIAPGGNMVIHRRLFELVPFDPYITRGEDIDYLINSRLAGFRFLLDKELTITHLPPEEYGALPYSKLHQDVIRFLYEGEKLIQARRQPDLVSVSVEELKPYPGVFLAEDVEAHALEALRDLRPADADPRLFPSPEDVVANAVRRAQESAPKYFAFAEQWPRMMATLARDQELCDHVRRKLGY